MARNPAGEGREAPNNGLIKDGGEQKKGVRRVKIDMQNKLQTKYVNRTEEKSATPFLEASRV